MLQQYQKKTKKSDESVKLRYKYGYSTEETEHTMPFIPPHLIKSRTRPRVSHRAEKLTTAQRSILVGSTSFYKGMSKYCENHRYKMNIFVEFMEHNL